MIVKLVVHGVVQGVGYRYFVKRAADAAGVGGLVRNEEDGSVLIIADSDPDKIEIFQSSIDVSLEHGIQVFRIERHDYEQGERPPHQYDRKKFVIKKD